MTEEEKKMQECPHAWQYDGESFGDRFFRCARCGMVRLAMPWETVHMVSKELKIRYDDKDGDI